MYFGWIVVAIAATVFALVLGTTFSVFGLFVVPVSADLNLSRAEINTALILLNLGGACLAPVIGRMLDWLPARRIMAVSAVLFGVSFVTLAYSQNLWLSAFIMAVTLAAAVQGGGMLTMSVLLARWFTAQRGRAMMLAFVGSSLGSVLVVPAIGWIMQQQGWRTALLTMGAVDTVALLLLAWVIRERPRPGELENGVAASAPVPVTPTSSQVSAPAPVGTILRMPQFWCIGLGVSLALAIVQTIIVTIVPLAIESGLTTMQSAGLVSVTGGAAIASKLLLSIVADRFNRIYMLAAMTSLGLVVNILLLVESSYPVFIACAAMLGVASSAMAPILYALIADRFGVASFGTVRGLMAVLIAGLGAVAVRMAGEVYDRVGSYDALFYAFMGVGALAVGLLLATQATRPLGAASLPREEPARQGA
jgi:MFS family permease